MLKAVFYAVKDQWLTTSIRIRGLVTKRPQRWQHGTEGTVLLIHGLNGSWIFMKELGDSLSAAGYQINCPNYNSWQKTADCAQSVIEQVPHPSEVRYVIGHSKGGLIARYIEQHQLLPAIEKLITIATPHQGSILGNFRLLNVGETRPNSSLINSLNSNNEGRAELINFYPTYDDLVIPHRNLNLPGAQNTQLPATGHVAILQSEELFKHTVLALSS